MEETAPEIIPSDEVVQESQEVLDETKRQELEEAVEVARQAHEQAVKDLENFIHDKVERHSHNPFTYGRDLKKEEELGQIENTAAITLDDAIAHSKGEPTFREQMADADARRAAELEATQDTQ